jgi:hypothetical protein
MTILLAHELADFELKFIETINSADAKVAAWCGQFTSILDTYLPDRVASRHNDTRTLIKTNITWQLRGCMDSWRRH